MIKNYKAFSLGKLYLLLLLGWVAFSTSPGTAYYTPSAGTFSGTTTYCQGATATANNLNYTECSTSGTLASGVFCTVQWYYNTTGGTVIGTSTPLGASSGFTSSASGSGTISYTPLTTTPGTFYYFAYVTWGSGYCTSPFISGTQTVTITTPPSPITAPPSVCIGTSATLVGPSAGTWHSAATSIATVSSGGVISGVAAGTAVISFTSTGCGVPITASVNVLTPPPAITGPSSVCQGANITLSDGSAGGTWSSSPTSIATINSSSGTVTGLLQGTTTVTYMALTGCTVTTPIAVNGPPGPIAGAGSVCQGSSITLTDPGTGGTWTSSNTAIASVSLTSGIVTGGSPGLATITYSNGCGPIVTATVTVNALPAAITGTPSVCQGATTTLSDATLAGTWSSTITTIATVSATGVVGGVGAGTSIISYTGINGCAATVTVNVIAPLAPISGPGTVCQGLNITLGALPTGGAWSSDNTAIATIGGTSGVVGGVAMGTALITYTAGVGCSAVRSIAVNPRAPIVGADSVCQGLSAYQTNIVGGGHWSSSNFSVATVVLDSGRVSGVVPGTTTIIYLLPTGCQSSKVISVVAFPGAVSGTTKACPGTTTNLSSATAGGVWSSSNPGIATVDGNTGLVTGLVSDTVTISYVTRPGCAVKTIVTINPLPAPIIGATPTCPGTKDSLVDATPGGLWSTTTPSLATVIDTSGITTLLGGGSAIIVYTLPTGCQRTKIVSVNPVPVPALTYDAINNTIHTPDVYVSYQWYDSIGKIMGATSPSVAALYNMYYYVVVTDSFGCQGTSELFHYNTAFVGVNNVTNNSVIRIFPNPTSSTLFIEAQQWVRAVVSSIDGKKELEQADAKQIDISRLASGMYFISFYDNGDKLLSKQKFVKE